MELSGNVYVCAYGDTFDLVAKEVYGDERYAPDILCANPELSGKYILDAGDEVYLPLIYIPEAEEDTDEDEQDLPIPTAPWK